MRAVRDRCRAERAGHLAKRAIDRADRIIKQHHLLTANQQGCTSLVYCDDGSNTRTAKVGVYEVHDKAAAAIRTSPTGFSIWRST